VPVLLETGWLLVLLERGLPLAQGPVLPGMVLVLVLLGKLALVLLRLHWLLPTSLVYVQMLPPQSRHPWPCETGLHLVG
jgi:hypothetical protein